MVLVVQRTAFDLGIHVSVDHHNVFAPVVIGVEKLNAPAQILGVRSQSGFVHPVGERAVAIVVIKIGHVVAEICLGDIDKSVFVIVGSGHAHAGLLLPGIAQGHAGSDSDLLEGAIFPVVIKQAGPGVAGHVQIGIAIVVEIGSQHGEPVATRRLADAARAWKHH